MVLALQQPEGISFAYPNYYKPVRTGQSAKAQVTVFFLLLVGFGEVPLLFRCTLGCSWWRKKACRCSGGFTGLKVGACGLLRFALPLVPDAALRLPRVLVGLGMIGVLYGAVTALGQNRFGACWYFPASVTSG